MWVVTKEFIWTRLWQPLLIHLSQRYVVNQSCKSNQSIHLVLWLSTIFLTPAQLKFQFEILGLFFYLVSYFCDVSKSLMVPYLLLRWFFSVRVCKYENQSLAPSGVYHKRMAERGKAGKGRFCPPHYYWHPQILAPSTIYVIGKNWEPIFQNKKITIEKVIKNNISFKS